MHILLSAVYAFQSNNLLNVSSVLSASVLAKYLKKKKVKIVIVIVIGWKYVSLIEL